MDNHLNDTIGGKPPIEVKEELIADEVQSFEVDSSYHDQIIQIIKGKGKYKKQHNQLMQCIKGMAGSKDYEDYELNGESKVYISMVPVFSWDCIDNKIIYNDPKIIVFSKDLSKMGICKLYQDTGIYSIMGTSNGLDTSIRETLEGHPKQNFMLVADAGMDFLISDKNEIFGATYHDIKVTGEYYQALKSAGIQISFEELTSSNNLVELEL